MPLVLHLTCSSLTLMPGVVVNIISPSTCGQRQVDFYHLVYKESPKPGCQEKIAKIISQNKQKITNS